MLPPSHPAWEQEAEYIAYALLNIIMILSPQRIVLGGGVMEHITLFPLIGRLLGNSLVVTLHPHF